MKYYFLALLAVGIGAGASKFVIGYGSVPENPMFAVLDSNHDGVVSQLEGRRAARRARPAGDPLNYYHDVSRALKGADANGDGVVDRREFNSSDASYLRSVLPFD